MSHVERMRAEWQQLSSRIEKLAAFLQGAVYPTLHEQDRRLMQAQLNAMRTYHDVLSIRILRVS